MLEELLKRVAPHIALQEPVVVPESGRFTLRVDGAMEITISALDHRQVLIESVVGELDENERAVEDYLGRLLQRSAGGMRESRSVVTIDPSSRSVVLFCTGNVEDMAGDRAVLWLESFLNELEALRRIPSHPPAWEMPLVFLRP